MTSANIIYEEKQRMNQWWLWLLIIGISVVIWYAFYQQIILDQPFGQNPANNWVLIIFWLLFGVGFPLFLYLLQLKVTITDDYLTINFYPLTKRLIAMSEIKSFEAVTYKPIMEYGGWGIRGWKDKRAYTTSGKKGVMIELTDGNKVLVGSQTPEKLEASLKKLI